MLKVTKDTRNDTISTRNQVVLPILNIDTVQPTEGAIAYDTVYNAIVYGNGFYWSKVGSSAGDVISLPPVNVANFQPIPGGVYLFENTNGATPTLLTLTNAGLDEYFLQPGEQISWSMKGDLASPGSCGNIVAGGVGQPQVAARYNGGIVPHSPTSDGALFTIICTAPGVYKLFSI